VKGSWVEPVPNLITGELKTWAQTSSVISIRIPGYWTHKVGSSIAVAAPPMPGEKVIYSLHGGSYTQLSAHPSDMVANIGFGLLEHVDVVHRVFSLEYRLSSGTRSKPVHPFPAALLDALAGYNYLVNVVGFSPSDIIVEGDSAGANLGLALTRYLIEYQDNSNVDLPAPPGALLLLSPSVDMGTSHDALEVERPSLLKSDIDRHKADSIDKDPFLGPHGMRAADTNRYISPASRYPSMKVSFNGFPRTFIVAGGAEIALPQMTFLKERMMSDLGEGNGVRDGEGKVRYYEARDAVHDYLVFTWHEPERTDTLKEIAKWVSA
jgi:acetyl esterase/lipase